MIPGCQVRRRGRSARNISRCSRPISNVQSSLLQGNPCARKFLNERESGVGKTLQGNKPQAEISLQGSNHGSPETYFPSIQIVTSCRPSFSKISLVIVRKVASVIVMPVSSRVLRVAHS